MWLTQKASLNTDQSRQVGSCQDQSSTVKYNGLQQTPHRPVSKQSITQKHVSRNLHITAFTDETKLLSEVLSEVKPIQP